MLSKQKLILCSIVIILSLIPTSLASNEFSWSNINGQSLLTHMRSYHTPTGCQSGWAFAAVTALQDRMKINSKANDTDIILSPQVLLTCAVDAGDCSNGNPKLAYEYIKQNNITEESCNNYRGLDHFQLKCSNTTKCMDCEGHGGGCYLPDSYRRFGIKDYFTISGEANLIEEITNWGPVVCSLKDYESVTNKKLEAFVVLVGYGGNELNRYWIAKSFDGTNLGVNGIINLPRGRNFLNLETDCVYPELTESWNYNTRYYPTNEEKADNVNGQDNSPLKPKARLFTANNEIKESESEQLATPLKLKATEELPKNWDWRNVNGTSYTSVVRNQHIPIYCGSCWAQAASSALADRFHIKFNNSISVALSAQYLINCRPDGGSCKGGSHYEANLFIKNNGIVDDSCLQYVSKNTEADFCAAVQQCQTCHDDESTNTTTCKPVKKYNKYFTSDVKRIEHDVETMKIELFKNGPIACSIMSNPTFHAYKGGIFDSDEVVTSTNHAISLVGYGTENGIDYWIGRNSWGTLWGENGFFRIRAGKNVINIEKSCSLSYPSHFEIVDGDTPIVRSSNKFFLE